MPFRSALAGAALPIASVVFGVGILVLALQYSKPLARIGGRDLPEPAQVTEPRREISRRHTPKSKLLVEQKHAAITRALPDAIVHLSRPELLLKPTVTRQLALSPEQQKQLRIILETYPAETRGAKADRELGERVLAVLTTEQQQLWRRVASQAESLNPQDTQP